MLRQHRCRYRQCPGHHGNDSISPHCWQGDDVGGFESDGGELGSGLAVTGNYLGKARTIDELQSDLEQALSHPGSTA